MKLTVLRRVRARLQNNEIAVVPGDYSCMLYKNYVIGPVNKIDGLFLSQLLFNGGRHVTQGRTAGITGESRVCRASKAVKSQIDTITPEFIAYVAMLVSLPTFFLMPRSSEKLTYSLSGPLRPFRQAPALAQQYRPFFVQGLLRKHHDDYPTLSSGIS